MCEFHESTCNGFGDIWWTDNLIYFSSIDSQCSRYRRFLAILRVFLASLAVALAPPSASTMKDFYHVGTPFLF